MSKALEGFMKANFDFASLKQMGVYPKDMKHTDYEGQAAIICRIFEYESVYEWNDQGEIRCHLSYADGPPLHINKEGELKAEPFVTVVNPNGLGI